ncbi:AIPR family protein [Spiroplasma turonicum]|uniref:Abortive phage infection protein C-terminal domain-containing protein n=1 Tax=Spiroplasma turonicum TaxID=216946 RepID=A0A0K1P670_9MOLU|nr:AIPR family protein [Spiroplasma turonicum]AKU79813.1 hypothetical protein STURON_00567 [Spiroplasma turonicum]ALX70831.1 hypothetical protein STURO_v1c05650 [Spiroplasma turonicum]
MELLKKYMNEELVEYKDDIKKLMLLSHYVFSKYNDINRAKEDYDRLICFSNNDFMPNLVLYDELEDYRTTNIFFVLNNKEELQQAIKRCKIFCDSLKENNYKNNNFNDNYFIKLLEDIYENEAFDFRINFIINEQIRDNDIKSLEDQISSNDFLENYGMIKIYDLKRLNLKLSAESNSEEDVKNQTSFAFKFENKHSYESGLSNIIEYETPLEKVIVVSILAYSLVQCYEKFENIIFDKNIRYSIDTDKTSKDVNSEMKKSVLNTPEKFFIFNNGITIVAKEMEELDLQNNTIKLKDFSIVNGAQTVTNLSNFNKDENLKSNIKSIYIMAKIINPKISNNETYENLIDSITKASNNQKPVKPRDFKSNAIEMITLKEYFKTHGVVLNIKRGDKDIKEKNYIKNNFNIKLDSAVPKINNDELGQYIYSLLLMKPTVSNQNKSKIFNDEHYKVVFKSNKFSSEDILEAYHFYKKLSNDLVFIDKDIIYDNLGAVQSFQNNIQNWLIALVWFIWCNINDLNALVNSGPYKKYFTNIDVVKNSSSLKFFDKNIKFNISELTEFIYQAYEILAYLYNNSKEKQDKPLSPSAFSFRLQLFYEFLDRCLMSKHSSDANKKVEMFKKIFIF